MAWLLRALALIGGGALSAWLHVWMTPAAPHPSPPAQTPAASGAPGTATEADCPGPPPEVKEVRRALLRARLELARAEAHRAARDGAPVPWPDVAGPLAPEPLREAAEQAIEGLGDVELLGMECDEFPCLLTLAAPHQGEASVTSSTQLDRFVEAMGPDFIVWTAQTGQAGPEDARVDVVTVALGSDAPPDGVLRRLSTRVTLAADEAALMMEDTGV